MVLLELAAGSQAAAVFTQNAFCAAPVTVARRHLATTAPRYVLINAGNAKNVKLLSIMQQSRD